MASGLILTCEHVITSQRSQGQSIHVFWKGQETVARVVQSWPDLDLALLQVPWTAHLCVWIREEVQAFDQLYSYGYPDTHPEGDPATFDVEGVAGEQGQHLKFKLGQVRPGFSGAPLLNKRTGGVCGVMVSTRDRSSAEGGRGVTLRALLSVYPELVALQQAFHHQDQVWMHARSIQLAEVDLITAEATYRQKVVDAYKWLNFSGFARPDLSLANVPLEEVFVGLSLTVEKVIREPGRGESRQRERAISVQEPVELGQALSNHLLIVGESGAGKSTLLRWLAVTFAEACQREPNRVGPSADADRLPVLVELGRLPSRYLQPEGGETPNWPQFLPEEYLSSQMAFNNTPSQLLTRTLAEGRCLLLFDGLDEITDRQARARIARSLVELARLFPGNRVIIGSRPAGVSESEGALRSQFQRCQIERFTPEDVQRFFRFWYALDRGLTPEQQREAADALYAQVQATPATLQLAGTPLLSTILLLIWRNEGDLPERRVDLYERCCRILIEYWERHHDIAYQGIFAQLGWERHLHLLAPLAYDIHKREERSASRADLIEPLTKSLQVEGICTSEARAKLEAEQFLETMGLRSGLLQDMGDNRYGFPHQTFQEYLAARYIAAQLDPDYIDRVMEHLHEAWWYEVHLLTIGHLGSRSAEASKASALILAILHVYAPPNWILRSSSDRNRWLRLIGPGKLLPQVQLERRIAWIQAREFMLATQGYAECVPSGTTAKVGTVLSAQAASIVRHLIYDEDRFDEEEQEILLSAACQLLQGQGNEVVVRVLLKALHDVDRDVRWRAADILGQVSVGNEGMLRVLLEALHDVDWGVREGAAKGLGQVGAGNKVVVRVLLEALHDADWGVRGQAVDSLGRVGVGNEAVVRALLEALHDADSSVRSQAVMSLGYLEIKDKAQVRKVLVALNRCLYNWDSDMRRLALVSIRQQLDGRSFPGYRWVSLRKRRAQRQRLKRIAFWLGMTAIMVMIGLAATWLLGVFNPNGFPVRFLVVLAGIIAFVATVAQLLGRTLRDPWEHS